MKLSKAQAEVMNKAKERIDFSRNHDFYEWYRKNDSWYADRTVEEIEAKLTKEDQTSHKIGGHEYEMNHYNMNRDGIDYLCHASSATVRKLEKLGLIEVIYDSAGEAYGFDVIKVLNY